jgi:hypothetical protein
MRRRCMLPGRLAPACRSVLLTGPGGGIGFIRGRFRFGSCIFPFV